MSILKNSGILLIGTILANVLAYAFHFLAGRTLGPEEYGTFGTVLALFTILVIPFSSFSASITRYASAYHSVGDHASIHHLRSLIQRHLLLICIPFFALLFLLSPFISSFLNIGTVLPIVVLGAMIVGNAFYTLNASTLLGMNRYFNYSAVLVFEASLRLILLYIMFILIPGSTGALFAYALAYFFSFLVIYLMIKRVNAEENTKTPVSAIDIYRFAFASMVLTIGFQSLVNLPTIIVAKLYDKEFTGNWAAAMNLARASLFVSGAVAQIIFNELSTHIDKLARKTIVRKGTLIIFSCHVLIALVLYLFSHQIIYLIYGNAYTQSAKLLEILGIVMIPLGLLQLVMAQILTKKDK